MEQYGGEDIGKEQVAASFEELQEKMTNYVAEELENTKLEKKLLWSRDMAKTKGALIYVGNSYGALKNIQRGMAGERPLSEHLDYQLTDEGKKKWIDFLENGVFFSWNPKNQPDDFMCDAPYYNRLKETITKENKENWYAHYQLGAMHMYHCAYKKAKKEFKESLKLQESCWACHGLACAYLMEGKDEKAVKWIKKGIQMRTADLSYVKEGYLRYWLAQGATKRYKSSIRSFLM